MSNCDSNWQEPSLSIAERMKQAIEVYAVQLGHKTQLAEIAERGELTPRAMALYLESLRYLFQNTQRHLSLAAQRCEQSGRARLAKYFQRKAGEEQGHDRWAINDLSRLPAKAVAGIRPAPAVRALVELQARFIQDEPLCFVAYLQWAEYFSVHVGDAWLDALAKSGYQRSQVSAIHNHLETDRQHAAAGFSEIDELLEGRADPALLLAAIEQAGSVFESLCDQICAEARSAA
jgi:pyrroloquinoline quinone (PQQ) biosynthesis protein C